MSKVYYVIGNADERNILVENKCEVTPKSFKMSFLDCMRGGLLSHWTEINKGKKYFTKVLSV